MSKSNSSTNKSKLPTDKLKCVHCDKMYTRRNKQQHMRSKLCKTVRDMTETFRRELLTPPSMPKIMSSRAKKPFFNKDGDLVYLSLRQQYFYKKLGSKKHIFTPV